MASWFGSGLILGRLRGIDGGSGTLAGALTLAVIILVRPSGAVLAVITGVTVLFSVWSAEPFTVEIPTDDPAVAARADRPVHTKAADPGWVVIDEAAGTMLSVIGLAPVPALVAFVVFRIADIRKQTFPGVAWAEGLPGGIGVTTDDVIAGLYGLATGWAVQLVLR